MTQDEKQTLENFIDCVQAQAQLIASLDLQVQPQPGEGTYTDLDIIQAAKAIAAGSMKLQLAAELRDLEKELMKKE